MAANMHWYNPTRCVYEQVPPPMSEAQAIEMLSGHPNSGEFIEEYRHCPLARPRVPVRPP